MQTELEIEKEKIKNEIKRFFDEIKINYKEDKNHLKIEGEIFYVDILQFIEISVRIGQDKYLTITYDIEKNTEKIILTYEEVFPKEFKKELEIPKDKIQVIYYTNNKLIFLF